MSRRVCRIGAGKRGKCYSFWLQPQLVPTFHECLIETVWLFPQRWEPVSRQDIWVYSLSLCLVKF